MTGYIIQMENTGDALAVLGLEMVLKMKNA
jgi:hypothetical protein